MSSTTTMSSLFDVQVSAYRSYTDPSPKNIPLIRFLRSEKHKKAVEEIRAIPEKEDRDKRKKLLPAITPSGIFSYREMRGLVQHSGLMQFDIDFKDNQHIGNYNSIKEQLKHIPNVAYCGLSVSGLGFWGLVPIAFPDKHLGHFTAIQDAFKKLGINIDSSCKDVSRLRGYSYDPDAYFNPYAKKFFVYTTQPTRSTYKKRQGQINIGENADKVELLISELESKQLDITSGYQAWFNIGCALANEFKENGREYYHRISQFNSFYNVSSTDLQYDECLKHQYDFTLGTLFYICSLHNVKPLYTNLVKTEQHLVLPNCESDVRTVKIKCDEIESLTVETKTGSDFDYLIMQTIKLKTGRIYDTIVNEKSDFVISHSSIKPLSAFYGKKFIPGLIDNEPCLLNAVNY